MTTKSFYYRSVYHNRCIQRIEVNIFLPLNVKIQPMLNVLHLTHFPETIVETYNSVSICLLSQELIQQFVGDDDYVRHGFQIGKGCSVTRNWCKICHYRSAKGIEDMGMKFIIIFEIIKYVCSRSTELTFYQL